VPFEALGAAGAGPGQAAVAIVLRRAIVAGGVEHADQAAERVVAVVDAARMAGRERVGRVRYGQRRTAVAAGFHCRIALQVVQRNALDAILVIGAPDAAGGVAVVVGFPAAIGALADDFAEGVSSFLAGRAPNFTGD